jgi:hypothetical protein
MKINHLLIYALLSVGLFGCGGSSQNQDANTAPPAVQRTLAGGAPQVVQADAGDAGDATAVRIAGYRDNYTIARNQTTNVVTVTSKVDNSVANYQNPSMIKFFDKWTSFDIDGPAGQVYRLYQAACNRKPDLPGLGFWIKANERGRAAIDIASDFVVSAEFQTLYGDKPSNLKLINAFYNNVLHRDGEKAGIDWWAAQMENGAPANGVLYGFSDSAENKNKLLAGMRDGFDYEPYLPDGPIIPKRMSYANAKDMQLTPITLPQEATWADAYAQADFKQNGTMSLFASITTYDVNKPLSEATPSKFAFYSKAADGLWIKETDLIDSANGCVHARKAVVNDFNNDGKPDVLVACQGYDAAPFAGEQLWLVLSMPNGKYVNKAIPNFIGYFHSATAADFDGDGNIDIIATDTNAATKARLFLGKGDGTFNEASQNLPTQLRDHYYYTVEATDVNGDGKTDLLFGANEDMNNSPSLIVLGDGTLNFAQDKVLSIPRVSGNVVVLDFVYTSGNLYINRTSGDTATFYDTKVIQKFAVETGQSSVVYSKAGDSWVKWLIPTAFGISSYDLRTAVSSMY